MTQSSSQGLTVNFHDKNVFFVLIKDQQKINSWCV